MDDYLYQLQKKVMDQDLEINRLKQKLALSYSKVEALQKETEEVREWLAASPTVPKKDGWKAGVGASIKAFDRTQELFNAITPIFNRIDMSTLTASDTKRILEFLQAFMKEVKVVKKPSNSLKAILSGFKTSNQVIMQDPTNLYKCL